MDKIPEVQIDNGKSRYVLIKIYVGDDEENAKYVIRGSSMAPNHSTIYEGNQEQIKKLGLETECVGGGFIVHTPDSKEIKVFGLSETFGMADHSKAAELLKKKYPQYTNITFSNEISESKKNRASIHPDM